MTKNKNKDQSRPATSERLDVLEGEILEDRAAGPDARARASSAKKPFPGQLIFFAGLVFLAAYLVWLWLDREDNLLDSLPGEETTTSEDISSESPNVGSREEFEELQRRQTGIESRTESLEADIAAVRDALVAMETRVAELETASPTAASIVSAAEVAALEERLMQLEERLQQSGNALNLDPATEAGVATENLDGSRLDALEERLAALEVQNQGGLRGETRYAVAVAELYRAALSGDRFDAELLEAEALLLDAAPIVRARTRPAVETLQTLAMDGVPAFFELQNEFTALIPTFLVNEANQEADGFWAGVWAEMKELVVVRRTGEVNGTGLEAVLAQAEARLQGGDLAGALDLLEELNPRPDALTNWLQRARTRTNALAALQVLADSAVEEKGEGAAG